MHYTDNNQVINYGLKAEAIELKRLLSEVKGFYIPEYQRPYTWTESDIERLFETIESSINYSLSKQADKAFRF